MRVSEQQVIVVAEAIVVVGLVILLLAAAWGDLKSAFAAPAVPEPAFPIGFQPPK